MLADLCVFRVAGRASEVVQFVISLECQVLHTVVQLFDTQLDTFTVRSAQLSLARNRLMQSCNRTDEQKSPRMLVTAAEMMDRFKKIVITSVNFVLFSSQ